MDLRGIDLGAFYDKTYAIVKAAILSAPGNDFGLEDIADEETWVYVLSSSMACAVPIRAALEGASDALSQREITQAHVQNAPQQDANAATAQDFALARKWLANALDPDQADSKEQQVDRVIAELVELGWTGDPGRMSSVLLAVISLAAAATV